MPPNTARRHLVAMAPRPPVRLLAMPSPVSMFSACSLSYVLAPIVIAVFMANIVSYQETNAMEQHRQLASTTVSPVTTHNLRKPSPLEAMITEKRVPRNIHAMGSGIGGEGAQHVTVSPTSEPRLVRVRPPAEQRLYSYLFDAPSAYLKHVRPVIDHANSVKVRLGVCIMTVDDIVEKDQTMLSTGCVKMKWIDEVLRWDPALFDNLTWIVIPSTEIWLPDVALVNSPDPFQMTKKTANVELSYTGEVGYYPSGRFSTRCPVTLTYFPFDTQLCELQFESWAYPVQQLELTAWPVEPVDMKSFVTNHQWLLDGVGIQPLQTFYDGFNFSTIRFHFFFHRRSLYYTVYAVYPCLLMAALQLFSHTLPVEHPGRMALLTSLFIGSSVVQSSITTNMPKSSDGISVIQVYLMLYSGSLLLSIIITSVNMHIFYRTPDDSAPGIAPLLSSFLLTFGIKQVHKTHAIETKHQDSSKQLTNNNSTVGNCSGGAISVASEIDPSVLNNATNNSGIAKLGYRMSAPPDSGPRNRRRSGASFGPYSGRQPAARSASLVVGTERENEGPRDEFELIVRKAAVVGPSLSGPQFSDGSYATNANKSSNANDESNNDRTELVSPSPTVDDLFYDQDDFDNQFADEEMPFDSDLSNSYYLLSGCTTAVRPVYELLPFVTPSMTYEPPVMTPKRQSVRHATSSGASSANATTATTSNSNKTQSGSSPSAQHKTVVKSNTSPSIAKALHAAVVAAPPPSSGRNRHGRGASSIAALFSRSPRKNKASLSASRTVYAENSARLLSTFHATRDMDQDWKDASKRWTGVTPAIFATGSAQSSSMGQAVIEEECDEDGSSTLKSDSRNANTAAARKTASLKVIIGDDYQADDATDPAADKSIVQLSPSSLQQPSSRSANAGRKRSSVFFNARLSAPLRADHSANDDNNHDNVKCGDADDSRQRSTSKSEKASGHQQSSSTRCEKTEQANRMRIRHAWLTYAAIIDKFFFYAMGITNFFAPIILFLLLPSLQKFPEHAKMNLQSYPTYP